MLAFTGTPANPHWLSPPEVDALMALRPDANTPPDVARNLMTAVIGALPTLAAISRPKPTAWPRGYEPTTSPCARLPAADERDRSASEA